MKFFESVFNIFLTREQRERIFRSNWEKSVAQAALELRLEQEALAALPPTPPSTPVLEGPTSLPMTPSLSSSSSHTAASSSGYTSPSRSRPSTSYSDSPRPEFRRHMSIQREPISFDYLMSSSAETAPSSPRCASHDQAPPPQMLYQLPPLDPMVGIGRFRRSVNASDEYLETLQRSAISARQPLVLHDACVSRNRRRDTTSPPRTNSISPSLDQHMDMQSRLAGKLEAKLERARDWRLRQLTQLRAQPLIVDCPPVAAADSPQQLPSTEMVRGNSRPIRVATRRRAYSTCERNDNKSVKRAGQAVGVIKRAVKTGKNSDSAAGGNKSRRRRDVEPSSSMQTLFSEDE